MVRSKPRPPPRIPHQFRIQPRIAKQLKVAALKVGLSKTAYIEQALEYSFNRDGIN
jgi:predicted HicB family RNase H-like nuclease